MSLQVEHSRKAPPQLAALLLRLDDDVRRARRAREAAEERVEAHAVVEDVERVVHRVGRVLLEVLPAVAAGLVARLAAAVAARAEHVRADRARVRGEQLLAVDEAEEVALVEEAPARGARAEAEVLARVARAHGVPVRVGREQRERVERGGEDRRDAVVGREPDRARGLGQAVVEVEPADAPRELQRVLGAQHDRLRAPRVPLRERLRPVRLERGDDALPERIALVLHRELQRALDENGGIGVKPLVCSTSVWGIRKRRAGSANIGDGWVDGPGDSQWVVEHVQETRQLLGAIRHLDVYYAIIGFRERPLCKEWWDCEEVGKDRRMPCDNGFVYSEVLTMALLRAPGEYNVAVVVVQRRMSLAVGQNGGVGRTGRVGIRVGVSKS